MSRYRSS